MVKKITYEFDLKETKEIIAKQIPNFEWDVDQIKITSVDLEDWTWITLIAGIIIGALVVIICAIIF